VNENKIEISCPCCEATIVLDRITGEILWSKEKVRSNKASLEEMVSQLEAQKADAAKKFDKGIESQKDRARLLEEKFQEALKRADKSDKPMVNPLDLD
jgi:hypothetical protein